MTAHPCSFTTSSSPRIVSVENGLDASRMTAPNARLDPPRIWRAAELRTKPRLSIASRTRASVSGASTSGRFSALDAVPSDTPASSATSLIVTLACADRCPAARDRGGFGGSLRLFRHGVVSTESAHVHVDQGGGVAAARSEIRILSPARLTTPRRASAFFRNTGRQCEEHAFVYHTLKRFSQNGAEALALWRGPPLADFAYEPFASAPIDRLDGLRVAALSERIEAARSRHRVEVAYDALLGEARRPPTSTSASSWGP